MTSNISGSPLQIQTRLFHFNLHLVVSVITLNMCLIPVAHVQNNHACLYYVSLSTMCWFHECPQILGAVTTYLVIIVQFQQSEKNWEASFTRLSSLQIPVHIFYYEDVLVTVTVIKSYLEHSNIETALLFMFIR